MFSVDTIKNDQRPVTLGFHFSIAKFPTELFHTGDCKLLD